MKTLPLSEAKAKLSGLVDRVNRFDDDIVITKNGYAAAVLISHDEYESLKETRAVRDDREFMKDIRSSLKRFDRNARLYSLEELFGK